MRRRVEGFLVIVTLLCSFVAGSGVAVGQDVRVRSSYRCIEARGDDSYYAQRDSAERASDVLSRSLVLADTASVDSLAYARAESAYLVKDYAKAETYLQDYTVRFPTSVHLNSARCMLGESQIALGKEEEGRYNLELAVEEDPSGAMGARALRLLAPLYEKKGELGKAYEAYMDGVSAADTPGALYDMRRKSILIASRMDDQKRVVEAADAMISTPGIPEGLAQFARYQRAYAQLKLGLFDEAYAGFSELGTGNKTEAGAECRYRMVEILLMKGEYDMVQQKTIWAAQQDKGGHDYWVARGYLAMARALLAQGKTLDARKTLNSLIRGYANDTDGIRQEAEEGMRAIVLGKKDW